MAAVGVRLEVGGVTLVRVTVRDETLFGRTLMVPVEYTELQA